MLAKCIVMTVGGFALGLTVLAYSRPEPETVASTQTESVQATSQKSCKSNSSTEWLDEVINSAETTIEQLQAKRFANDKQGLIAELKQVRADLDGKIARNPYPSMDTTFRQSKELLGVTIACLEQGEVTPHQAQEIAVITFQSISKQATRSLEFKNAVVDTISEKMKGHEKELFEAALKGVEAVKE